jgi:hypothetical protein
MLGKHHGAQGRAYRRAWDALALELGPFDRPLLRLEAGRVAAAWVNVEIATATLAEARRRRDAGRGRRPSAQAVERMARRQGLADGSYIAALDKLRDMTARNGHPKDLASRLLAEVRR